MTKSSTVVIDSVMSHPLPSAVDRLLARAKRTRLLLTAQWGLWGLIAIISGGVFIHADNVFNYPRYQMDEGTYMAAAWSVAHGQMFPYTYTYGHPPLGWALIAAWCQLTGGFFTFGTSINTGRVFMIVIYACSALLVYLITRRLSGNCWLALLATALFSFSPMSVYYQREIYLDNIATFWILVACYLQVASGSRLRYITASAFAFGISILSKETMIVLLPVFLYGTWLHASSFQKKYFLIVFGYVTVTLISAWILLAILKNELFPTGTLLGGNHPHVSMITTFLSQLGRGGSQGSFRENLLVWLHEDQVYVVVGLMSIVGNLLLNWRKSENPGLRVIALAPLTYIVFLARGGVTFDFYIIPILPFLALNSALCVYGLISLTLQAQWRWWRDGTIARWIAPLLMIVSIALLLPYDIQRNQINLTANATQPEVAAMQWMGENLPRSAKIVVCLYAWLDSHAEGGIAASHGAPFQHVEMYWEVTTDPAIRIGVFHDDWNTIDYIVSDGDLIADANGTHMALLLAALRHAVPIKNFQNQLYQVTVYQVRHIGSADTNGPTPIQQGNLVISSSGTGATPKAPTTAPTGG